MDLVEWSNGFLGKAGSLFMLITVFCFFTFIVFQWDIKPLLQRAKNQIPARRIDVEDVPLGEGEQQNGDQFKGYRNPQPDLEEKDEEQQEITIMTGSNNRLKDGWESEAEPEEELEERELEMTIIEKPEEVKRPQEVKDGIHLELPQEALFVNEPEPGIEETPEAHDEEEGTEEASSDMDFENQDGRRRNCSACT